jgi:hypothetical protein
MESEFNYTNERNVQIVIALLKAHGIHRYFLRQYDGCGKSGNGCGGDFHQCEADRGKLPQR